MKPTIAALLLLFFPLFSLQCLAQDKQPPATLRSLLLHELQATHNKADWFVPINTAIDGLSAQQASWQPPNGNHSSGQLAYHLLFWNRRQLHDLKGEPQEKFSGKNDDTFTSFDDKQWNDIVKGLDQVMNDYEKLVESATDQQLAQMAVMIGNISMHNAYHVGQIVIVRKLQGSWNPEKGVK